MNTNVENKFPTLRFPSFEDNWKNRKVIDLLDKIIDYRGKAPPKSEEGVTLITARNVKAGHLDFSSREFINYSNYDDWMNRGLPTKGDVIFTTEAPLGNVCMFPETGKYALGQRTITLRAKQDVNSGLFIFYLLQSPDGILKIARRATGSTAKGIKSKVFQKISFSVPELAEQEKIAGFLDAIATHLTQLRRKHELLQTYKRGVMQKIFSQQIRFKQDDGSDFPDWEKKKLSQLFQWVKTNSFSRAELNYKSGTVKNIHYGDIHGKFKPQFKLSAEEVPYITDSKFASDLNNDFFCRAGDIVMADASEDYADIGKAIEIIETEEKELVAGLHCFIARPKEELFKIGFSGYLFQSENIRKQIKRLAQGVSVLGISKSNLDNVLLSYPHPQEQKKIASFLTSIDQKLEAVERQIEGAEKFKQGLLQKMFV